MKRIAHLNSNHQITNVTLADDDWQAPQDGSAMLEQDALALGYGWTSAPAVNEVSMRALRLALVDAGRYQSVLTALAEIPDEIEKTKATVWWETSAKVERSHYLVSSIGSSIGLSAEQIDALFQAASALEAAA